ncbi:MAG: DUF1003 domain-containing protein [Candidatus Nanopelagicales bacterium]
MADRRSIRRRSNDPSLDEPYERGRSLKPSYDPELFGRVSERIARYIGSWKFIAWMTVLIVAWILFNIYGAWSGLWEVDPFPFIFLTLLLSLQASYAAPLILLAQNRQDDRDRVQYQEDRDRTDRLIADTEYLVREIAALRLALGEVATRDYLRGELKDLMADIAEILDDDDDQTRTR